MNNFMIFTLWSYYIHYFIYYSEHIFHEYAAWLEKNEDYELRLCVNSKYLLAGVQQFNVLH